MRISKITWIIAVFSPTALASIGDTLPEFHNCLEQCYNFMSCSHQTIFEKIESAREQIQEQQQQQQQRAKGEQEAPPLLQKREISVMTPETQEHPIEDFATEYEISALSPFKYLWSCEADCNYKCQQIVTNKREKTGLPVVQFYGKWPFTRVFGVQEFFSTVFSLGNFYVNYISLDRVVQQYYKNSKSDPQQQRYSVMVAQYVVLIVVSLVGWSFSSLFHLRDNNITETLDYFGASAIILSNFNAIVVRYFSLFKTNTNILSLWYGILLFVYVSHCVKLLYNWDYWYNTMANLVVGVSAMVLWCLHALNVKRQYSRNYIMYNNSIQLLPFETKLLTKLNHIGLGQAKLVPVLPALFNLWLFVGVSFEFFDWAPIQRLVDAHSIWHLFTILPTIFWYDWNIWDIEMMKITDKALR
ncbi:Per1-like-domain-containing protein [Scheffersomyces xylosifermentans]|uniref:Per1-like-domain-containing protein n=1 Tax=Scheffersomyces xylosifermentans TaxID=1304137 RepID=UPI00315D3AEE